MNELDHLMRKLEAALFASGQPIERRKLSAALNIEEPSVHKLIQKLKDKYVENNSAINILILDDSYQMSTYPEHAETIRTVLELTNNTPLSNSALEVLAVIAYNQPVTRAFVEEVRGVDCSYMIRGLVEKDLIEEAGRMNVPGKPILYQTTTTFLRSFNLESIDKLPTLPELPNDTDQLEQVEGQIFFEESIL